MYINESPGFIYLFSFVVEVLLWFHLDCTPPVVKFYWPICVYPNQNASINCLSPPFVTVNKDN